MAKKRIFGLDFIAMQRTFTIEQPFPLESGAMLPKVDIAYHVHGNPGKNKKIIWVYHALTGSSDPLAWWPGIVGKGRVFDPDKYTIVCANMLGSCYGTTGPESIDPNTGQPYLKSFPLVTVRDMAYAHELLRQHLGIETIHLAVGSSLGGFQALEYAIMYPGRTRKTVFIAAGARTSPWAKAFNEAQRMALEADPDFHRNIPGGGKNGLKAARAIGMISYRSFQAYGETQHDPEENNAMDGYRAPSYQRYQGEKLSKRFSAHAYHSISKAFDSHDVGRNRGGVKKALSTLSNPFHCIGIQTDLLFPPSEIKQVSEMMPNSSCTIIESLFGHDGFLVENDLLTRLLEKDL